jgi:hypothetical protein
MQAIEVPSSLWLCTGAGVRKCKRGMQQAAGDELDVPRACLGWSGTAEGSPLAPDMRMAAGRRLEMADE